MPIFFKLFHEIEIEGTLPNSLYKDTVTFIHKTCKDATRKENYRPISLVNKESKLFK